jgi:hypothetical protein
MAPECSIWFLLLFLLKENAFFFLSPKKFMAGNEDSGVSKCCRADGLNAARWFFLNSISKNSKKTREEECHNQTHIFSMYSIIVSTNKQ